MDFQVRPGCGSLGCPVALVGAKRVRGKPAAVRVDACGLHLEDGICMKGHSSSRKCQMSSSDQHITCSSSNWIGVLGSAEGAIRQCGSVAGQRLWQPSPPEKSALIGN